jgi:N6-L-threonylcarbamoyladenine synthase
MFAPGLRPSLDEALAATPEATRNLIAAFQHRVIEELLNRALQAAQGLDVRSILVSGGVAANKGLRERFVDAPYPVYFPTLGLSTDNAAMIAAAAYPRLARGERSGFDLATQPNLALDRKW